MHDLFLVCIVNGAANRAEEVQPFGDVQLMAVAIGVERLPFDVLHHEVGQTVFRRSSIQQAANVWMIESREDLSFFAKAAQDEVSIHPAFDQFYCSPFVELIIGAGGFINRAHAAAPNLSVNSIGTQTAPKH